VNLQVEVLAALLRALRNGDYTLGAAPSKLVLVGHSFG
jgi:acetyl esterase/lipase